MTNIYSEELKRKTLPLIEDSLPAYAQLLERHWDEVLALFCAWDVVRFHNFLAPGTQTGNQLSVSLMAMEARMK